MSFTKDLLTGLAAYLHSASVGTWKATGAYTSGQTAIVIGALPQTPDRAIALAFYPVEDSPSLSDSVAGVQVITRWGGEDPTATDDLADGVFDALHGMTAVTLSTGVRVVQCLHQSGASLGRDGNGRWERSDNYYLTIHRPSTHRS